MQRQTQCPSQIALACLATVIAFSTATSADEPRRLTNDGRRKLSPSFINAKELVYVDLERPELTAIKRLQLSDLSVRLLHDKTNAQQLEPSFSPDGQFCVFLKATGTLTVSMVIRNEKENTEVLFPPGRGFCGFRSPRFSPDRKRIIYSYADNGRQDLYSVNTQAKDRKQLTKSSGMNYWPSFSPDGKRIVFGSTRDGNYEIYTMNAKGKDVKRLTDSRFQDVRPQFSPDGKQIAFTSNRDGNFEVYLMDADGSSLRRVTNHPERDDYPTWHPDGKRLVMVSERDGTHDLYLVAID
jgi:Tol biopolymer transport system component